jgi:hypothetical protein
VIEEYKNPKSRITKVKYLANLNKKHLLSFLVLSIGSLILVTEDRSNLSNHYYITDRAFTIHQGGIIDVDYGVKQNDTYLSGGLNPVTVEFIGATKSVDAINYGYLPQVSGDQITNRGFAAWIYSDTLNGGSGNIFAPFTDDNGIDVYLATDGTYSIVSLYSKRYTVIGNWYGVAGLSIGNWYHILVAFDHSSVGNKPSFYVNGVLYATVEAATPSGTLKTETGCPLVIGNWKTSTEDYTGAHDGKIFDPRVYDMSKTTLTAQQLATALYNGGTKSATVATEGLVFHGFSIYADWGTAASLAGHELLSTDRLTETILRAVGTPHGAGVGYSNPTIRANP